MLVSLILLFAIATTAQAFDGSADVTITAAPNLGPARVGTITITGCAMAPCQPGQSPITQTFTVTQASGCAWPLTANLVSFDIGGGPGSVGVLPTDPACLWAASSNADWIVIASFTTGLVKFNVNRNNGKPARSGTLTIAGQTFTVNQAGRK